MLDRTRTIIRKRPVTVVALPIGLAEIILTLATGSDPALITIGIVLPVLGPLIDLLIKWARFRRPIGYVTRMYEMLDEIPSANLEGNMRSYIDELHRELVQMTSDLKDGMIEVDKAQLDRFIKIVFKTPVRYEAIDVSLPSRYLEQNAKYLEYHQASLNPDANELQGYRIILQEPHEIEEDSKHPEFSKFWQWHEDNKVELKTLPIVSARRIIQDNGMNPDECSWGIGVWEDEFAIMFARSPSPGKESVLRIFDHTKREFASLKKLCGEINSESEVMYRKFTPRIMKDRLIDVWETYVNPEKRWNGIRPFMYHFFDDCRSQRRTVIDMAAGIGIEYQFMKKDGFLVQANEVQNEFRESGERYRRAIGVDKPYSPHRYVWSDLTANDLYNMYGGLFVTGNSIRMLGGRDAQQEAVSQFYEVLQDGGVVMIDERNHERFIRHMDDINMLGRNKDDRELFRKMRDMSHMPNPMYHGSNVIGVPYEMDESTVTFCYYYNNDEVSCLRDAEGKDNKVQDWTFYHHERMEDILAGCGFVDIRKYADYDLNRRIRPDEDVDNAAMFVYTAKKPAAKAAGARDTA